MIRRVSKKRALDNVRYKEAYELWKPEHECCERCGRYVEYGIPPHHKFGRIGELLYDILYWMCTCNECHAYIEKHREESYEKGWLIK